MTSTHVDARFAGGSIVVESDDESMFGSALRASEVVM